ncbi:MAG: hypothetical protein ACOYXB_07335 [Bacteroidota bacterium]
MKNLKFAFLFFALLTVLSCGNSKKDGNKVIYEYNEEVAQLSPEVKARIGDWVEQGVICYGVVVSVDADRNPIIGKPVKAKVLLIKSDGIKMKALESVSVAEGEKSGCSKMGISQGETWVETEGDLFKTREEAENFLKEKGLY